MDFRDQTTISKTSLEEDQEELKLLLERRHFRLKLYEYCFKMLYGNYPLRQLTDNMFIRSQSLEEHQIDACGSKKKWSSANMEQKNNRFLIELSRQIQEAQEQHLSRLGKNKHRKHRSQQVKEHIDDVSKEASSSKPKEVSSSKPKEVSSSKPKEGESKPNFTYLRKSNFKALQKNIVKYYVPKKYARIHHSTKQRDKLPPAKPIRHSTRFSSSISARSASLPARRKKDQFDKEDEIDRQALEKFIKTSEDVITKQNKLLESEPKVDTDRSWASNEHKTEEDLDDNEEINFERSWSAWNLKKAELLEWDADVDFQPVGPQEKKLRQKYYRQALIKEGKEIERKRKVALQNTMPFANIRYDQIMKDYPAESAVNAGKSVDNRSKSNKRTNLKLPVHKLKASSDLPPQEEEEGLKEVLKQPSFLGQIKNAIKDFFGGDPTNTEERGPVRSSSIDRLNKEATIFKTDKSLHVRDDKDDKHHLKVESNTNLLHKHNLRVDSTLGSVLLSRPNRLIQTEVPEQATKMQQEEIVNPANEQRKSVTRRSPQELDKLRAARQESSRKRNCSSTLPKLPQIKVGNNPRTSVVHLASTPKQREVFDPIGNPYRSAGRKYSPTPASGWPSSRSFNPEVGRCKIIDFIEKVRVNAVK